MASLKITGLADLQRELQSLSAEVPKAIDAALTHAATELGHAMDEASGETGEPSAVNISVTGKYTQYRIGHRRHPVAATLPALNEDGWIALTGDLDGSPDRKRFGSLEAAAAHAMAYAKARAGETA